MINSDADEMKHTNILIWPLISLDTNYIFWSEFKAIT